jgi:hypothetical protein
MQFHPYIFGNPFFFLPIVKNTPITGFFVCQRKGKFDFGVFSSILGKECQIEILSTFKEERKTLRAIKSK